MATRKITVKASTAQEAVAALEPPVKRSYKILEASLKDGFCNYNYEITEGIGLGDSHSVKGSGIFKTELREAFTVFNVHMAVVDDVFKHSDVQFPDINKMHGDDLATIFTCTGFKISGGDEDESIILIGNKYVSLGGRIELKTPKIPLDNLSSYKWYNELKAAADNVRNEVARYKEGNYDTPDEEEDEEKENKNQGNLFKASEDQEGDDFESAMV